MGESVTRRRQSATSVTIDPDRVYQFFRARRLPLSAASVLLGRCDSYLSVCMSKRRMSWYAIDDIAVAFGMHADAVLSLIASDEERQLLSVV
jgi:hypothetical protein